MDDKKEEKKVLKFDIAVIDPKEEELNEIVAFVKDITADPTKITKKELELVSETRNKLVKARVRIEKACKADRDDALQYQRENREYEKKLIGIIEPEEIRLKKIETDTKEYNIRQVRLEKLPESRAKLEAIGDGVEVTDEFILHMDPNNFDEYYNNRVALKNEADRLKLEEESESKAKKLQAEKDKLEEGKKELAHEKEVEEAKKQAKKEAEEEAEKKRIEAKEKVEKERKENVVNKINERIEKLTLMGLTYNTPAESYVLDDINVPIIEVKMDSDEEFATKVEKIRTEIKNRNEAKEEKDRIALEEKARKADEKYQAFLKENGYTEETKDQFNILTEDDTVILYKKVGEFKKG